MTLAARQALLARFVDDPVVEQRVRGAPDEVARAEGVELAFVRWLAALEPRRVAAFRRSRAHKERRREGGA